MRADGEHIAHVRQDANSAWKAHPLNDHLSETAKRAGNFADTFGNRDWAELLGFWHDLGKFHPAWQEYLQRETGYDEEAHVEGKKGRPNHSSAGALLAI